MYIYIFICLYLHKHNDITMKYILLSSECTTIGSPFIGFYYIILLYIDGYPILAW